MQQGEGFKALAVKEKLKGLGIYREGGFKF